MDIRITEDLYWRIRAYKKCNDWQRNTEISEGITQEVMLPYWEQKQYQVRYVEKKKLQEKGGIDLLLKSGDIKKTVDIKNIFGCYNSIFIEGLSCSIKNQESPGWIHKNSGMLDTLQFNMIDTRFMAIKIILVRFKELQEFWERRIASYKETIEDRSLPQKRINSISNCNLDYHTEQFNNKSIGYLIPISVLEGKGFIIQNSDQRIDLYY